MESKVWMQNGKIIMEGGKVIFCRECPCGCFTVSLVEAGAHQSYLPDNEVHYFACLPIGPFPKGGTIRFTGDIDDDFRIKIGGRIVYSGTDLGRYFNQTFPFEAGETIDVEFVETYYYHNPRGSGGPIAYGFSGIVEICGPTLTDEDFE